MEAVETIKKKRGEKKRAKHPETAPKNASRKKQKQDESSDVEIVATNESDKKQGHFDEDTLVRLKRLSKDELINRMEAYELCKLDAQTKYIVLSNKYLELVYDITHKIYFTYEGLRAHLTDIVGEWKCPGCDVEPMFLHATLSICGHVYCQQCILRLKKKGSNCPYCGKPLLVTLE